jgi:excisionase family DNA binding protein
MINGIASDLVSIEEAAAIVGVSGRRIRVFVAEGRLPAVKIGARVLAIARSDAAAFSMQERHVGRPRRRQDVKRNVDEMNT